MGSQKYLESGLESMRRYDCGRVCWSHCGSRCCSHRSVSHHHHVSFCCSRCDANVNGSAIIENASNRNTISGSVLNSLRSLAVAPHRFIFSRPFALVFILYSSTYLAANGLDTASSTFAMEPTSTPESEQRKRTHLQNSRDPAYTTSGTPKFLATSITNLSLCVYKDSQFAKYFGAPTSTRPVPPMSLLLFGARDALTIFASFNLPAIIAPRMSLAGIGLQNIDQAWENHVSRASAAQFLAPAAVQVFSTPLHLLGLDLYNRQDGYVSRVSRFHKIWSDWGKSCMARVCRIVPAFGVGGVVNTNVRREWMRKLPSQHI